MVHEDRNYVHANIVDVSRRTHAHARQNRHACSSAFYSSRISIQRFVFVEHKITRKNLFKTESERERERDRRKKRSHTRDDYCTRTSPSRVKSTAIHCCFCCTAERAHTRALAVVGSVKLSVIARPEGEGRAERDSREKSRAKEEKYRDERERVRELGSRKVNVARRSRACRAYIYVCIYVYR